jgi:hypothetical protein
MPESCERFFELIVSQAPDSPELVEHLKTCAECRAHRETLGILQERSSAFSPDRIAAMRGKIQLPPGPMPTVDSPAGPAAPLLGSGVVGVIIVGITIGALFFRSSGSSPSSSSTTGSQATMASGTRGVLPDPSPTVRASSSSGLSGPASGPSTFKPINNSSLED